MESKIICIKKDQGLDNVGKKSMVFPISGKKVFSKFKGIILAISKRS